MALASWQIFRIKNRAPFWRVFGRTFVAFLDNDLPTSSAAMSYFCLLMLFPLLILLIGVGESAVGAERFRQALVDQFLAQLPGTRHFINESLETVHALTPGMVLSCLLIVLWASSWMFTVVERALNRIWMTPPRSFVQGRLLTTGMVGASGAILLVSALLAAGVAFAQAAAERRLPISRIPGADFLLDFAMQVTFAATSLLVTIGLFMLIYKIMPNTRVYWIEAVPGAILSGGAWELLKYGFASSLPWFLEEYRAMYGSIWLALVLLTWVYISSNVLLFGAQLTAYLHCDHVFKTAESSVGAGHASADVAGVELGNESG
jgi:membrane protein